MSRRNGTSRHPTAKLKGGWSPEEDDQLIRLVKEFGEGNWSPIARALNEITGKNEMTGRIGKQCRERWNHHLSPGLRKDPWTHEEEELVVDAHMKMGNRWSDIARCIEGRSENAVKNHWNATLRKRVSPDNPAGPLKLYLDSLNLSVTPRKRGSGGKRKRGARERETDDDDEDAVLAAAIGASGSASPRPSPAASSIKARSGGAAKAPITPKPSSTPAVAAPRAPKRAATAAASPAPAPAPPKKTNAIAALLSGPFNANAAAAAAAAAGAPAANITKLLTDAGVAGPSAGVTRRRSGRRAAQLSNQRMREMAEAEQREEEEEAKAISLSGNKSGAASAKATESVGAASGKMVEVTQEAKSTMPPAPQPSVVEQPLEATMTQSASFSMRASGVPLSDPVAATAATHADEVSPFALVAAHSMHRTELVQAADPAQNPPAVEAMTLAAENPSLHDDVVGAAVTAGNDEAGEEHPAQIQDPETVAAQMAAQAAQQSLVVEGTAGRAGCATPVPFRNCWSTNNFQALHESTARGGGKVRPLSIQLSHPPSVAGDEEVNYDDEPIDAMMFEGYDGEDGMAAILDPGLVAAANAAPGPIVAPPEALATMPSGGGLSRFGGHRSSAEDDDTVLMDSPTGDFQATMGMKHNASGSALLNLQAALPPTQPTHGACAAFGSFNNPGDQTYAPSGQNPLTPWEAPQMAPCGAHLSRGLMPTDNDANDAYDGEMLNILLDPVLADGDADPTGSRARRRLQRSSMTMPTDFKTAAIATADTAGEDPAMDAFDTSILDAVAAAGDGDDSCVSSVGSPTSGMYSFDDADATAAVCADGVGANTGSLDAQVGKPLLGCEPDMVGLGMLHLPGPVVSGGGLKRESSFSGCCMARLPSSVQPSPHPAAFHGTSPWGSGPTAPASPAPWWNFPAMAPRGAQLPSLGSAGPLQGASTSLPSLNWQTATQLQTLSTQQPQGQSSAQCAASAGLFANPAMQPTAVSVQESLSEQVLQQQSAVFPSLPMTTMQSWLGLPTPPVPIGSAPYTLEHTQPPLLDSPTLPGSQSVAVQTDSLLPSDPSPPTAGAAATNLDFSGYLYGAQRAAFYYQPWAACNAYGGIYGMMAYNSTITTPTPQLMMTPGASYTAPNSGSLASGGMAPGPAPSAFNFMPDVGATPGESGLMGHLHGGC